MVKGWTTCLSRDWLSRAVTLGVLGFYSRCEVTEVIAFPSGESSDAPINIFSIVVLENHPDGESPSPLFLSPKERIKLKSLKGWKFGIYRYFISVQQLASALDHFESVAEWKLAGKPLRLGDMVAVAPQFVPPDATEAVSLNRVLKNNFWNGAYVLEWFDESKQHLQPLLNHPPRIQELSEVIQQYLPLQIASLSDRLGNIIVQIPITAIMAKFHHLRESDGFLVDVAWHPQASLRPLRATCSMEYDDIFCGYAAAEVQADSTTIPAYDSSLSNRHLVWDPENQLILAATGPLSYLREISFSMEVGDPEPRIFWIGGKSEPIKIQLRAPGPRSNIGEPDRHTYREWTRRRIYDEEARRLEHERRFVQYRPKPSDDGTTREKALTDIRYLIDRYGAGGVWLWDPYLSARDILDTLFYCKHSNADLRGLTVGNKPPEPALNSSFLHSRWLHWVACIVRIFAKRRVSISNSNSRYIAEQKALLDGAGGNYRGLKLKYRIKMGAVGWSFHDRFLIFPDFLGQTLVWSLGTSVNSLGTAHHILQRVDNGRLVMEAFMDLWDQLDGPEHTVWEKL